MKQAQKIILITICGAFIWTGVSIWHQINERHAMAEIYSQVLAYRAKAGSHSIMDDCKTNGLHFSSRTNGYPQLVSERQQEFVDRLPQLKIDTWENFVSENEDRKMMPLDLDLGCEYTIIEPKENDTADSSACPVLSFSRIGFNENRGQAFVYLGQYCAGWISGQFYLLNIVDNQWIVIATMPALFIV
jgi:hypothetical protein